MSGSRIVLDAREERAIEYYQDSCAAHPQLSYVGICFGCNRRIPAGYLTVVTKWKSVMWGTMRVLKPLEQYCRDCSSGQNLKREEPTAHRRHFGKTEELSAKDIAMQLWPHLKRKPKSARKLALEANLQFCEKIAMVLDALVEAGKVMRSEMSGRYYKATK